MRKVICIEDKRTIPGQYLLPGSIKWPEDSVPVTNDMVPRTPDTILGRATDIQRNTENGEITAEIELREGVGWSIEDLSFTIYAQGVTWGEDKDHGRTVEDAMLYHVYIDMDVPWKDPT